ncbi:MAG: hypothetical protein LUM44_17400 [Pyrinomonadaceae bacterium]|nr:hypothetical protein [Pyrinomonadaceae bacterium]
MKIFSKFRILFLGVCLLTVGIVTALVLSAEKHTGAENYFVHNIEQVNDSSANNETYINALEKIRNEYSNVKNVEMEANVAIEIIRNNSIVAGTGQIIYIAKDNKYKYSCTISENLQNEGLMRDVYILYNGSKFYFYDPESKIVSSQSSEEVRLPAALPNPFFLPIEFLSNDDDNCEGCKMRLQDVKMPIRWAKRVSSISELTSENSNGTIHSLIQMPGGDLNKIPYNYRVRLVGDSSANLQPISISRVKGNGIPLAELLLNDLRTVPGINVKIPHNVEVGARDETGNLNLKAVFTVTKLKVNQTLDDTLLAPNFAGAEKFWDSDTKTFVNQ